MTSPAAWRNRITRHAEVDPSTLVANEANWRRHPQFQADALAGVLSEVGYVQSVIVNERSGRIVDGHLRVALAVERGEPSLPVVYVDLADDEERLVLATLDPIGALAETDAAALAALLDAVAPSSDGLADLLASLRPAAHVEPREDPGAQIDRAEELRQKWGTERGQVWEIGRHRLLCGDSTSAEDVARLCVGGPVAGVFTSPPYAEQRKKQYGGIASVEYVDWWGAVQSAFRPVLAPDGSVFVNIKPHVEEGERSLYVLDLVAAMRRRWGWAFVEELCWLRPGVPKAVHRRFKNAFEPVYQFALDAASFKFRPESVRIASDNVPRAIGPGAGDTGWSGDQGNRKIFRADQVRPGRTPSDLQGHQGWLFGDQHKQAGLAYPSNVLRAHNNRELLGHEAAFPPELPAFFLQAYSDEGDVWLDPFLGSGSTTVAAEQTGRISYGLEIEPKYVAVTLERLAGMGLDPRLTDG